MISLRCGCLLAAGTAGARCQIPRRPGRTWSWGEGARLGGPGPARCCGRMKAIIAIKHAHGGGMPWALGGLQRTPRWPAGSGAGPAVPMGGESGLTPAAAGCPARPLLVVSAGRVQWIDTAAAPGRARRPMATFDRPVLGRALQTHLSPAGLSQLWQLWR